MNVAEIPNLELEEIISFNEIYDSMHRCKRGVTWKSSVASFVLNDIESCLKLSDQLKNGTYKARKTSKFTLYTPKRRDVVSIAFRDRVYQRSLNDNSIYPTLTNTFIAENFACQKGKGTDRARNQLIYDLRSYYRKHGNKGYVLQCDIHGYYPNMRHDVAKEVFRKLLPDDIYWHVERIIDDQYDREIGFNPGSQMIQIAGISVLNPIDHYAKEDLRLKWYQRYMDDFIAIHNSKEYLEECLQKIKERIEEMGFEFNPKKTRVFELSEGIEYLGFRFRLTDTGKVLMFIDPDNVKREKRKLVRMVAKVKRGEMDKHRVDEHFSCWLNSHASKGTSYKLVQNMKKFYYDLWRK